MAKAVLVGQEEKDVHRVFDHLAGFARRSFLSKGLVEKQTKHSELPRSGTETEREQLEREIAETKAELKTRMDDMKKVVTIRDLDQALRALNRVCTKKQLEVRSRDCPAERRQPRLFIVAPRRALSRARPFSARAST